MNWVSCSYASSCLIYETLNLPATIWGLHYPWWPKESRQPSPSEERWLWFSLNVVKNKTRARIAGCTYCMFYNALIDLFRYEGEGRCFFNYKETRLALSKIYYLKTPFLTQTDDLKKGVICSLQIFKWFLLLFKSSDTWIINQFS